ncbi:transglutaminase family protein [Propionicimonas sp.]|uniref:transglutaminase family protein n=1 Tax=Propionicimonas sp. TaxID=1955623 RepID=UPI0017A60112|nr:transglutaminase family protein [Propionicimonas sp.]MBU3977657.1 transglutaminase family protein [Actinomycetota bacterium]MBA3021581.1 transglutaminase family protein [Propionicimonas sp.]MBU3987131.1 transglutaminase family protein [Actinomycetota bacterium]MBU4008952.1 transglutaminase family protein [Actinomycetota bacterium]MBU4065898.1 transglutaminase family protein [Actinomycetota bacterium]
MGRQLRVVHHTGYHYAGRIGASHNEARMTPRATREQFVQATRLDITPVAWTHSFVDYWGTQVTAFEIAEPHTDLEVVATSTVDVGDRLSVGSRVAWDEIRELKFVDQHVEMLTIVDHVDPGSEMRRWALDAARQADCPADAVTAIIGRIRDRVAYVPGSTEVSTRASAVWDRRAGVCQDLVHLGLGALRTVGIPARYVSGYVMPSATPVVGEGQTAESHAWLQYWDGAWVGVDPTNDSAPGDFHVEVGVGRDYFDVPPLKGVYAGSQASDLFVEVEITVLA